MTGADDRLDRYMSDLPEAMSRKLNRGRERYGDAWLDTDPRYLRDRMEEEVYEFRQAVEHYEDPEQAIEEMADVVNFGLMALARHMEEAEDV